MVWDDKRTPLDVAAFPRPRQSCVQTSVRLRAFSADTGRSLDLERERAHSSMPTQ